MSAVPVSWLTDCTVTLGREAKASFTCCAQRGHFMPSMSSCLLTIVSGVLRVLSCFIGCTGSMEQATLVVES